MYFTGDPVTRRWGATDYPDFLANWKANIYVWNAANFGWAGDTVQNVLWRLTGSELDGVKPKVIVALAGTNSIGTRTAADGEEAKVGEIVVNAGLERMADGKKVRSLSIDDKLADTDGKLLGGMSPDRLHLSAKGYQVWADALKPVLTELLGPPAKDGLAPPPTGDPGAPGKPSAPPKK